MSEDRAAGASPVTMVERVAEALWQARHARMFPAHKRGEKYTSWAEMVSVSPESPLVEAYRFFARAAIAAMREPTEAMMDLGATVRGNHQPFGSPHDWNNDTNCAGIWRAMIDRALKP